MYKDKKQHNPKYYLGMNPDVGLAVQFDSDFECGNLDFIIQTGINEYDIFVRNDSNTRGHTQWFYFSVHSKINQKLKFTIMNLCKLKSLYHVGMKPYIFDCLDPSKGWY